MPLWGLFLSDINCVRDWWWVGFVEHFVDNGTKVVELGWPVDDDVLLGLVKAPLWLNKEWLHIYCLVVISLFQHNRHN